MRSLSSTVAETPSTWRPSRSVVSKTSTCRMNCSRELKEPPGGRLDEHVGGPRVLLNDDDGGAGVVRHRCTLNPESGADINTGAENTGKGSCRCAHRC